jgi:hypothetical protein
MRHASPEHLASSQSHAEATDRASCRKAQRIAACWLATDPASVGRSRRTEPGWQATNPVNLHNVEAEVAALHGPFVVLLSQDRAEKLASSIGGSQNVRNGGRVRGAATVNGGSELLLRGLRAPKGLVHVPSLFSARSGRTRRTCSTTIAAAWRMEEMSGTVLRLLNFGSGG